MRRYSWLFGLRPLDLILGFFITLLIYIVMAIFFSIDVQATQLSQTLTPTSQVATSNWRAKGADVRMYPYGDTTKNEWDQTGCTGTGNHYQCIDDITADDATTYLTTTIAREREIFKLPDYTSFDFPASPDTIKNIDIVWTLADVLENGGTRSFYGGVIIGANHRWGAARTPPIGWTSYTESALTCPGTRTWDQLRLDSTYACIIDSVDAGANGGDVTQIYARFDWIKNSTGTDGYLAINDGVQTDTAQSYMQVDSSLDSTVEFNISDFTGGQDTIAIDTIIITRTCKCNGISETAGIGTYLNIGGTHYYADDPNYCVLFQCNSSWTTSSVSCIWVQNPATSAGFTIADVNALIVGLRNEGVNYTKDISNLSLAVHYHVISAGGGRTRTAVIHQLMEGNK